MNTCPNVTTGPLQINELKKQDAIHLLSFRSHPIVSLFQTWNHPTLSETESFIESNA